MKPLVYGGVACFCLALVGCGPKRVGPLGGGASIVSTGQMIKPAGDVIVFGARPVDIEVSSDGKTAFLKDNEGLRVFDLTSWKEKQAIPTKSGASLYGIAVTKDAGKVYVTTSDDKITEFTRDGSGEYKLARNIVVHGSGGKGNSFPCGIVLSPDEATAYVCLSLNNTVGIVDLASGDVKEIPVGVAPYDIKLLPGATRALVSNIGGGRARAGAHTSKSAGTDVEIDERGLANHGTVSVVDLAAAKQLSEIKVGLQPAEILVLDAKQALVANANADSVSRIDLVKSAEVSRITVKPDPKLPFGSMPNAMALAPDGKTLYVCCAGNNAVAVVDFPSGAIKGFIPTEWYPAGIVVRGGNLYVINNKGEGSRQQKRAVEKGWNSHDRTGSIQRVTIPDAKTLATLTKQVMSELDAPQIFAAYQRSQAKGVAPAPVPRKLGEPSVFKHVIYVIKENRTYDQVFGDIAGAERDSNLCIFGEEVTPNLHVLAKTYALLDNYYCNGVLSADGHSWATEGNVTPYLERAFGGFNRSYTFGDDPLTYSTSGFIWDRVLAAGLSFRNYGEMDNAEPPKGMSGRKVRDAYNSGEHIQFGQSMPLDNLRGYSCREYPGWNMDIPDQIRMDRFMKEFEEFKKKGSFPSFVTIYLPQDHTGGPVTARANVADNDYAVGRLVEAVSNSPFWKDTVIFINEDDPQAGFDHVDGHRSICLVISPYTKRGAVVSEFYNQTSVLHTILQIFGLPPLNQRDASSPLMSACFTSKSDLTPFKKIRSDLSFDEYPKATAEMSAQERYWAEKVSQIDLSKGEVQTEEQMDILNRFLWHSMKGFEVRYPEEWAGAHGRGLAKRGLKLDKAAVKHVD